MRNVKIENYDNSCEKQTIHIDKPMKIDDGIVLLSEKDRTKFIKTCELLVRSSKEYKEFIKYFKNYYDIHSCAFFTNLDTMTLSKVKLEIHHEPFSLFDITNIVLNKHLMNDVPLNYFRIASEVTKLHYDHKVGLIPLSVTVHQLYHLGKIFIPIQAVDNLGLIEFVKEYEDYIPEEQKDILVEKIKASKEIEEQGYQDLSILGKKYTYLEIEGQTFPRLIEE